MCSVEKKFYRTDDCLHPNTFYSMAKNMSRAGVVNNSKENIKSRAQYLVQSVISKFDILNVSYISL